MDKRIIFAVAGSGKTTYIVSQLSNQNRSLILTYTTGNYENLYVKICKKFDGKFPNNVTLMTYFQFLYRFCYQPLLADEIKAKGIQWDKNPIPYAKKEKNEYYLSSQRFFYSNRLAFFLENKVASKIRNRLERYYDEFIIDEIQDIAGRDFNFLMEIIEANIEMLFVGDFYQHTFDTSQDGNVKKNLFNDKNKYEEFFIKKGFTSDEKILERSWRCSPNLCDYIRTNLGIAISSNHSDSNKKKIEFVNNPKNQQLILNNNNIIKLHYEKSDKFGENHKNWGETKGEDKYNDICVLLNKETLGKFHARKLSELKPRTKNKLYVALTRAHGNVYLIDESVINDKNSYACSLF